MNTSLEPAESVVSRIEQALEQVALAADDPSMEEATRRVVACARDLSERIAMAAPLLRCSAPGLERTEIVRRIRRLLESSRGR